MWIARNKDGSLSFFVLKPVRLKEYWAESDDSPSLQDSCMLPKRLFPEVNWEGDPVEVVLTNKTIPDKSKSEPGLHDIDIQEIRKTLGEPSVPQPHTDGLIISDVCRGCPNHFTNGGSGICCCMLAGPKITC